MYAAGVGAPGAALFWLEAEPVPEPTQSGWSRSRLRDLELPEPMREPHKKWRLRNTAVQYVIWTVQHVLRSCRPAAWCKDWGRQRRTLFGRKQSAAAPAGQTGPTDQTGSTDLQQLPAAVRHQGGDKSPSRALPAWNQVQYTALADPGFFQRGGGFLRGGGQNMKQQVVPSAQLTPSCRPHKCPVCEKRFRSRIGLVRHSRDHPGVHWCKECGEQAADRQQLRQHRTNHHPNQATGRHPLFKC